MAITTNIDSSIFAKNKIIASIEGGEVDEAKHRYFIDVMRDFESGVKGILNQFPFEAYPFDVADASIYNQKDKVLLHFRTINLDYDASEYVEVVKVDYQNNQIYFSAPKKLYRTSNSFNITYYFGKADRLSQVNRGGKAYFEVDKIMKNYLRTRFNNNETQAHRLNEFTKQFRVTTGQSFVKNWVINFCKNSNNYLSFGEANPSSPLNVLLNRKRKMNISTGDYITASDSTIPFYNGTTKVSAVNDNYIITDKPLKFGESLTESMLVKRADNTPYEEFNDFNEIITPLASGFNNEDIIGLTPAELTAKEVDYTIQGAGKKFLSYAPRNQRTLLSDEGYLYYHYSNITESSLEVIYKTYDELGLSTHTYTLTPTESGVYAIPSNPKSINKNGNDWITCNTYRYEVSVNSSEVFKYELINSKRFNSVRLIWNCKLGSYQGMSFTCKNAVMVNRESNQFMNEHYHPEDSVRFNTLARGKQESQVRTIKEYTLQSDYVNEDEAKFFETLMLSNDVMMQYDGGDLRSVVLKTDSIEINEKADGLIQYKIKVTSAIYEN